MAGERPDVQGSLVSVSPTSKTKQPVNRRIAIGSRRALSLLHEPCTRCSDRQPVHLIQLGTGEASHALDTSISIATTTCQRLSTSMLTVRFQGTMATSIHTVEGPSECTIVAHASRQLYSVEACLHLTCLCIGLTFVLEARGHSGQSQARRLQPFKNPR